MANRTTTALVAGIIEYNATTWSDIEPFITTANEIVTEKCTDSSYSATRLELIERWLSAHFLGIADKQVASEQAGPGQSFQYKVDLNLASTMYGQTAMAIDTAGNLAALNQKMKKGKTTVSITWLGTDYYEDEETE